MTLEFDRLDVERAADGEADALLALGVQAGDSVGWLAHNSLRTLALLEACRRMGARYVPLPFADAARMSAAVRDAARAPAAGP